MKRLLLLAIVTIAGITAALWAHPPLQGIAGLWLSHPPAAAPITPKGPDGAAPGGAPKDKGRRQAPSPPVTVAIVALADMPVILAAPGSVESGSTVAVKPRVDGQIAEVLFNEGDLVERGQPLFRLDDRLVRAQIAQVDANIRRDEAQLADAEATYERRAQLMQKQIVSEAAMETARAAVGTLKASIAASRAALEAQRTQLDYLSIPAPIRGRTGSTNFKPGANVRAADAAPLVTINQTQPVSVIFSVPQTNIVALRRALSNKAVGMITIPGPQPVVREGVIDFIDNQVDRQTGTISAKIEAPNQDELLWPGLAVDVALTVEVIRDIPSVPVSAVLPAQQGMIVWIVDADSKVTPRPVTLARIVGQIAYVSEGLQAGERVVTDGQGRIAGGMTVSVKDPNAPTKGGKDGERRADERKRGT